MCCSDSSVDIFASVFDVQNLQNVNGGFLVINKKEA